MKTVMACERLTNISSCIGLSISNFSFFEGVGLETDENDSKPVNKFLSSNFTV